VLLKAKLTTAAELSVQAEDTADPFIETRRSMEPEILSGAELQAPVLAELEQIIADTQLATPEVEPVVEDVG
jgi:hypothetical protein